MKNVFVVVLFCIFANCTTADLCSYNFSLSDLPEGAVAEVLGFILGIVLKPIMCDGLVFNETDIKFYLSTRNAHEPTPIQTSTVLHAETKTILILHGWLCNINNELWPELREAYLKEYDANIIMADWSAYSGRLYVQSYCFLPKIAKVIAKFLCDAANSSQIDISHLHVVGHSMGGQLTGLVGQEVQLQCQKKIFRITALDPAGPYYIGANPTKRLDPSDANYVDVIHTNMGILGYLGNCGTVDFYPNLGVHQSGCLSIPGILESIIYPVACSHLRSVDFMIESINSAEFKAKSCLFCGGCVLNIFSGYKATMGEHVDAAKTDCGYYLYTNDEAPFAQG